MNRHVEANKGKYSLPHTKNHWPIIENTLKEFDISMISNIRRWTDKDISAPRHTFVDDWRLEPLWRDQYLGISSVIQSPFCFTPDYTVYANDNYYHSSWQIYRSRLIGAYWYSHGLFVIPVLQWQPKHLNLTLEGLSKVQILAVRSPTKGKEREWFKSARAINDLLPGRLFLHFGTRNGITAWSKALQIPLNPKPCNPPCSTLHQLS